MYSGTAFAMFSSLFGLKVNIEAGTSSDDARGTVIINHYIRGYANIGTAMGTNRYWK